MAAFKFFNIGKANTEIERLAAELTKVSADRDEARAAVEGNNSEAVKAGEELQVKVSAHEKTIESLNAQVKDLTGKLATAETEAKTAKESSGKAASQQAAAITGAQGQPPIKAELPTEAAAGGDIIARYTAIKDPQARTTFYRQNKSAIDAAHKAQPVKEPGKA
jgi:septal ring factor EnvC (AmiA/AmiB activator)